MTNEMTAEEAIHIMNAIIYMIEPQYDTDRVEDAVSMAIKALEQQPNRCDSCTHSEEQDGSNCYECVKGMADNFEAQPCEDCISRQAVLDVINFEDIWLIDAKSHNADTKIAFSAIKSKISELPPVTSQRPKGKWIYEMQTMNNPYTYQCSVCKEWQKDKTKYCPNCGAEMSGGGEDV